MHSLNWERLRILKAVLDGGSFSAAARELGISQPTVSRQIRTLEQDLGKSLLELTADGIVATRDALDLLPALEDMLQAATTITRPKRQDSETPTVQIACGPWVARFLSSHAKTLVGDPVACHVEIASSILFADMPRREADIAIRTRRPEKGRMRVRSLPHYHYAVYGHQNLVAGRDDAFDERRFTAFPWAMLAPELNHFATSTWLIDKGVRSPAFRCSASVNLLDTAKSGDFLAVLPCFAADADPALVKVSESFVPDSSQIWMVLPEDVRRRPHVRFVADRIVGLFETKLS